MKSMPMRLFIITTVLLLSVITNPSIAFAAKEKPASPPASDVTSLKNNQNTEALDQELSNIKEQQKKQ